MEEYKIAYLAGMLDADGSLSIRDRNDSKRKKLDLRISNNSIELMNTLKEWIPEGYIYKHRNGYVFAVWKHSLMAELLNRMMKYLIIKKDKAKILLDYLTE